MCAACKCCVACRVGSIVSVSRLLLCIHAHTLAPAAALCLQARLLRRLQEVALGMDYLHSRGIMHSDLKVHARTTCMPSVSLLAAYGGHITCALPLLHSCSTPDHGAA